VHGSHRLLTIPVLPKHQDLVMNIRRESLTTTPSVDQDVVKINLQSFVVLPQSRESIRNSRKLLK